MAQAVNETRFQSYHNFLQVQADFRWPQRAGSGIFHWRQFELGHYLDKTTNFQLQNNYQRAGLPYLEVRGARTLPDG